MSLQRILVSCSVLFTGALFCTQPSGALPPKLPPAPASWNGNDGVYPPLTLRFSGYSLMPGQDRTLLWTIWEAWESPDRTRTVTIYRNRLKSRKAAVEFMNSPNNMGHINFSYNDHRWDKKPALGSNSLNCITYTMGSNRIWFVQDKELIDLEYRYPNKPPSVEPYYQRTLQIGRTIIAKIRATKECGEDERDDDDDDRDDRDRRGGRDH